MARTAENNALAQMGFVTCQSLHGRYLHIRDQSPAVHCGVVFMLEGQADIDTVNNPDRSLLQGCNHYDTYVCVFTVHAWSVQSTTNTRNVLIQSDVQLRCDHMAFCIQNMKTM